MYLRATPALTVDTRFAHTKKHILLLMTADKNQGGFENCSMYINDCRVQSDMYTCFEKVAEGVPVARFESETNPRPLPISPRPSSLVARREENFGLDHIDVSQSPLDPTPEEWYALCTSMPLFLAARRCDVLPPAIDAVCEGKGTQVFVKFGML